MNDNYKYLRWSGILTLVILSIFLITITKQVKNTPTANTISFSGEGEITAKPDTALVRVVIFSEAKTAKEAEQINAPKSKAVVDFLKKQDINEKDIKTAEYQVTPQYVYPVYPYPVSELPKIKSYQAHHELEVKIRAIDKIGSIIDGVISAGANKVSDTRLVIDNLEKLQEEARTQAIADAKKKARDLEKQLGIKLGKIVNFYENTGGFPGPLYFETKNMSGDSGAGVIPEIPIGENEIKVDITITYQIK